MAENKIIESMLRRKSIRKYNDRIPTEQEITDIVRAGQQAPFAAQLCSVMLSRKQGHTPFKAPLLFTICIDAYKLEAVMAQRGWSMKANNLFMFFFGLQDAMLVAENMVNAAESLDMGSCFIGMSPNRIKVTVDNYKLPKRVFPAVQLTVGFPDENPPPRPRYPIDFFLFEDTYPELNDEAVVQAMKVMDDGYLAQDYYRRANFMVKLEDDRKETFDFDSYGWTEHMGRKWGQWFSDMDEMLEVMRYCGFAIDEKNRSGQQDEK